MNTVIPVANGSGGIYTDSRTYIHLGKAKTVILSQDECDALTEDIGQTITPYHSEELYSRANVSGSVYHSASYKRATKGQQDAGAGRGVGGRRNRQRWGPEEPLEVGSGGTARGGGRRNRQRWGLYPGGWNRDAPPPPPPPPTVFAPYARFILPQPIRGPQPRTPPSDPAPQQQHQQKKWPWDNSALYFIQVANGGVVAFIQNPVHVCFKNHAEVFNVVLSSFVLNL